MPPPFPILEVPPSAVRADEQMGTKPKFWYDDPLLGRALFKDARRGHGEDWAEKAAQELAALLGVPRARYELAVYQDPLRGERRGVASASFVNPDQRLVHGNELLAGADAAVAIAAGGGTRATRSPAYTVGRVLHAIVASGAAMPAIERYPDGVRQAADVLVGYLLVDAWIGNTDRHEENWAVIDSSTGPGAGRVLAPYYDSASCLGRNEPDEKRRRRLQTRDPNDTVAAYARRARSAFFDEAAGTPVGVVDAFLEGARVVPAAGLGWLGRLEAVGPGNVADLFSEFPPERLSVPARGFAEAMLDYNRGRLLALRDVLEGLPPGSGDTP